jgi:hypothetical protein
MVVLEKVASQMISSLICENIIDGTFLEHLHLHSLA